jgi:hypothetical protein
LFQGRGPERGYYGGIFFPFSHPLTNFLAGKTSWSLRDAEIARFFVVATPYSVSTYEIPKKQTTKCS